MALRWLRWLKPIATPSRLGVLYLPLFAMLIVSALSWMILLNRYFPIASNVQLLDTMFLAAPEEVRANIESFSPEAFFYHRMMLLPDLILPLGIGYFFFMAITFLTVPLDQAKEGRVNAWSYVAFAAMIVDYLENACSFTILSYQGKIADVPEYLISTFVMANFFKFITIGVMLLVFATSLARWLNKGTRNRNGSKRR